MGCISKKTRKRERSIVVSEEGDGEVRKSGRGVRERGGKGGKTEANVDAEAREAQRPKGKNEGEE